MHWKALSSCPEVWPPEVFWKKPPSHLSALQKPVKPPLSSLKQKKKTTNKKKNIVRGVADDAGEASYAINPAYFWNLE